MRTFRLGLSMAAAAAVIGYAPSGHAFHSGGVGECEGCHSMHNSFEGQPNIPGMAQFQSGRYLLKAQDQAGTCLNCHHGAGGFHISTPGITPYDSTLPGQMTPGGDFAWLKKTMTGSVRRTLTTWEGDRHGHNIISADYGYTLDKVQNIAPGGTYPATALACSSCHDPHGRYRRDAVGNIGTPNGIGSDTGGSASGTVPLPIFNSGSYTNSAAPIPGVSAVGVYRLLAGRGYSPKALFGPNAFVADPPSAVAPSTYNAANTTISGIADRVAYGRGMSEWCANCHGLIHRDMYTSGTPGLTHPAGNQAKLTAAIVSYYSAYRSSGDFSGSPSTSYSALAPFEVGTADYSVLVAFQATPGPPTTNANVACVTCHRAHASGFESMTRFYLGNEFMTVGDASNLAMYDTSTTENKINAGYDTAQQTNAYNGRPATLFGPWARDYCNKCHAKD